MAQGVVRATQGFERALSICFPGAIPLREFVEKATDRLQQNGFNKENTLACVGTCRDEMCLSLLQVVKQHWGEPFNISGLAGMVFCGRTPFFAARSHAPIDGGVQRMVYFTMPHIAITEEGVVGYCRRPGIDDLTTACGALCVVKGEIDAGKLQLAVDHSDMEMGRFKRSLFEQIPYGSKPGLVLLTNETRKLIDRDLDLILTPDKVSDQNWAAVGGIMIHGPLGVDENGEPQHADYVWPGRFDVWRGHMEEIRGDGLNALFGTRVGNPIDLSEKEQLELEQQFGKV